MKNVLLLKMILLSAILLTSCAKDRDEQENQAQKDNVIPLSTFANKTVSLRTTKIIGDTPLLSDAKTLNADISGSSISSNFKMMAYETESKIFSDVPFFALPGEEYKLLYEVTNTHLIINKVAKPTMIPFHEKTFAKEVNGELIVPMIGYPIALFRKERILNADNEATNQLLNISVQTLAEATHMSINYAGRKTFEAVKKQNVLPVNLFISQNEKETKEWFYSSTIVGAPPKFANLIGRNVTADFTANPVSRIKFVKTKNSIIAVNLNIDSAIDLNDENNFEIAIQIPIEWIDYRRKVEGVNQLLEEESLDNKNIKSPHFSKRRFFKADFRKATTANSVGFNDSFANDYILDDLEISDGYVSFVTHHRVSGIKTRYSFSEAHAPKKSQVKQYFKTDRDVYGYFDTYRNVLNNHRQEREVDQEKNILINHYMPNVDTDGKRRIVYYFSVLTPEPMKNVGRLAVYAWNEAFKKAGTDIEVVLDETKIVNLGDVRYNTINVVDTKNGGNLLGYGPTIADSETGEIISGSSNIYADPFREGLIGNIRNYIRSRLGLFAPNYLGSANPSGVMLDSTALNNMLRFSEELYEGLDVRQSDLTNYVLQKELKVFADANKAFQKEEERLRSLKGKMNIAEFLLELESSESRFKRKFGDKFNTNGQNDYGLGHYGSFESSSKDIIEEIEERCKTELDAYIADVQAIQEEGVYHNENELEVIYACIDKKKAASESDSINIDRETISLLEARVLSTLVHEMGHNFSLRHNFIASTDTEHFTKKDGKAVAHSSSVMDYNNGKVFELLAPGQYDIEAIRFLYASKVREAGSKKTIAIDKTKALKDQKVANASRVKLKFCTDEDASYDPRSPWSVQVDPMCARHDNGRTPLEVVEEHIKDINSIRAVSGYRYDRARGPWGLGIAGWILRRSLFPLKKVYVQWRYHLARFVGEDNQYLENYNAAELAQKLEEMKNSKGVHATNYALYHDAAKKAYGFLKDLAFTTGKYCVTEKSGTRDLIDFDTLQDSVYKSDGITIKTCEEEATREWVKANNGAKVVDHVGEFVKDIKTTLDPTDPDFLKNDVSGVDVLRRFAFAILVQRSDDMRHTATARFWPNFLDNPNYLNEIGNRLIGRTLNGLTHQNTDYGMPGEYQFLKFRSEDVHLAEMMMMFRRGLSIPGNQDASSQRGGMMLVIVTQNPNEVPEGYLTTTIGQLTIATHPRAFFGANLVQKRIQLQQQQDLARTQLPEVLSESATLQLLNELGITPLIPTQAAINDENYKFSQLLEMTLKVQAIFNTLDDNKDKLKKDTLNAVLSPMLVIATNQTIFTPEDRANSAAKVLNETYAQSLAQIGFTQLIAQAGSPVNMFAKEFTFKNITALIQNIEAQRTAQQDYILNRKDRDSQLNMITDMLLRLGGYAGIL